MTNARYRRIEEEYMRPYSERMSETYKVIEENTISGWFKDVIRQYVSGTINALEKQKRERQYVHVTLPILLLRVDDFLKLHAVKLRKINDDIMWFFRRHRRDFIDYYVSMFGRRPTRTEVELYDSFLLHLCNKRTVEELARLYNVAVGTMRVYVWRVRVIINQLLTDFYHAYDEIRKLVDRNGLSYMLLPRGIFGTVFWDQVYSCRFYSFWHIYALRCQVVTGLVKPSEHFLFPYFTFYATTRCFCDLACYLNYGYFYVTACREKDIDICYESVIQETMDIYNERVPMYDHEANAFKIFIDWEEIIDTDVVSPSLYNEFKGLCIAESRRGAQMRETHRYPEPEHECLR